MSNPFGELAALLPQDYGQVTISPDPVPEVVERTGYGPNEMYGKDLWPRKFAYLFDVSDPFGSGGKVLKLVKNLIPDTNGKIVEYGYPSQLETLRAFSIAGQGTADPVNFNGTQDVQLLLRNVSAQKLETPRAFSLTGDITAAPITFDGTDVVIFDTVYNGIVPDDKLPSWIDTGITNLNTAVTNLANTTTPKAVVIDYAANHTLTPADIGNYIRLPAGNVVVPTGLCVKDDVIYIRQSGGAGGISISGGAGVSITPPYAQTLVTRGIGSTVALVCVAANTYDLIGQTAYA
jgi:hypothetical protein